MTVLNTLEIAAARRLAAIVTSSDDAIVSKDVTGIVLSWNRGAERMFGYTADEAIGQSIMLIVPDDRRAEEDEVLRRIRAGQSVEHFETIRRRKDGTLIPISLSVSPIVDDSGTVIGASKIARDITERKAAEASLAAAEAARADLQRRLLTLVTASGSLVGTPDVDRVLAATMTLARDMVAADGYVLWQLDDASRVWQSVLTSGLAARFTEAVRPASSESVLISTEPVRIEDVATFPMTGALREVYRQEGIAAVLVVPMVVRGVVSRTLAFYYRAPRAFHDVEVRAAHALGNLAASAMTTADLYGEQRRHTERAAVLARASAALSASLDYRETLAAAAQMAVPDIADWWAVDLVGADGAIERVAAAPADPAGTEPVPMADIAGVIRSCRAAFVPFVAGDARAIAGSEVVSSICVPLGVHGRAVGAITFVSAASRRRFTESDLAFANDLATRAGIAIENARAYDEARRANRVKDAFLATLSHELRTPLNAILGYTRMIRAEVFAPEKRARALDVVERNARSLSQIVNDVLDVSRIEAGKLRLNVQSVDLTQVVLNAIDTVLPAASGKTIEIERRIAAAPVAVIGDPDRLQQVAWNLLSNAMKFTPAGGRVQVRVERTGPHALLEVTDTGIGIAPGFLPHVFEPFRQAEGPFTREFGGLGLGLAITRHIVEMHGGTIHAQSDGAGAGATMRVLLPADRTLEP